jgi:hypothetical protein
MIKRLHTRTKIFFQDPYVVRLEYQGIAASQAPADYRKLTRLTHKLIQGTWGFSTLEFELVHIKNGHNHPVSPGPSLFNGMSQNQIISSLFDSDWQHILRAYICFKDEMDALQFRLSIDTSVVQVKIWPQRWFTIHEVVTDES